MTPYCGKCHKWLDGPGPDETVCGCNNPDLTKDPNCHNSGHAHHDPESPILKMDRQVAALEEAIDTGRNHEWGRSVLPTDNRTCSFCGADADSLEGDAWAYCPVRTPKDEPATPAEIEQYKELGRRTHKQRPGPRPLDDGYDAKRINWPRLWERVLASVINAIFYGTLLVAAKALGLL